MLLIRQERINKAWTLEKVARQVGVTNQSISRIETGKSKPSFDVLAKLEDLFGKDYRELFNLPPRQ